MGSTRILCIPTASKKNLWFQKPWIINFSWLVYSKQLQGVFYMCGVLFLRYTAGKVIHQHLGFLVTHCYINWKNVLEDFKPIIQKHLTIKEVLNVLITF